MDKPDDCELMREYVEDGSHVAFARLAERHVNLVYSVALRLVGNAHDAQDVSQSVFVVLARKAASLSHRATLTGWLYETTRLASAQMARSRLRRQAREQEAYIQSTSDDGEAGSLWRQLGPLLEEGMARLAADERALLALRFFENKTGAETAVALGISESAAHKRTSRALERLRRFFAGRGVHSTAALIMAAVSENSIRAAPAGLAKALVAATLAQGAGVGGSAMTIAQGALKIMAWSQFKSAAVGVLFAGLVGWAWHERQAQDSLNEQIEQMRAQIGRLEATNAELVNKQSVLMRLPGPRMQRTAAVAAAPEERLGGTNLDERLRDKAKLTRQQVESYLSSTQRSAAGLLAAFRTTRDTTLLRKAMEKFPGDPQVAFEAAVEKSLSPDEQRQWLTAFEKNAPNNALANYLSALNYFNNGQTEQAVLELSASYGKTLDDYTQTRVEDDEEAYLAAAYSMAEAKQEATSQLLLPQLSQIKQLGIDTVGLANSYAQAGDAASAQAALQVAAAMGQQYATPPNPGEALISQLVGMWVENHALSAMDPNAPFGNSGGTVQDQINQLAQEKAAITSLDQQAEPLMPQLTDQDWILYKDRWMMFGEENAMQWVVSKYGQQSR